MGYEYTDLPDGNRNRIGQLELNMRRKAEAIQRDYDVIERNGFSGLKDDELKVMIYTTGGRLLKLGDMATEYGMLEDRIPELFSTADHLGNSFINKITAELFCREVSGRSIKAYNVEELRPIKSN